MRILVRAPAPEDCESWQRLGWRAAPDFASLAREHEAFRAALAAAGAEVIEARGEPGNLDSVYVYDPTLITPDGRAVLLNPGKEPRGGEPEALRPDLEAAGIAVAGRLADGEHAEGGDTVWLDDSTLLVGHTYRTNEAGIAALRRLLPGVDVRAFPLPHHHGEGEVLHLRSLLNPISPTLAVAYLPLMPVPLVELLAARGVRLVEVPDEEFETMGPNVLGLDGGISALALAGNDETRRRLETAGVEVHVYDGDEISRKGDGGPTCLTLPLSPLA
ncbi:MAG TPA: arginine deiminase-related protein [Gaiellaceae bacterium]|nr:arginine deiminase-related protein [Gaiellaceae bacterium]